MTSYEPPPPGERTMSGESVELKPCPFCGGEAFSRGFRRLECRSCGAEGPSGTKDAAIAAWNRRAPSPEGWALVPREPTEEMILAACPDRPPTYTGAHVAWEQRVGSYVAAYRAMVSAAPSPEGGGLDGASGAERARTGPRSPVLTDAQHSAEPCVHHHGAALRGIADQHADVLTPRQIKALYEAGDLLQDPFAERVQYLEEALACWRVADERIVLTHGTGGRITLWKGQSMVHLAGAHGALMWSAANPAKSDASSPAEGRAGTPATDEPTPTSQEAGHE